MTDTVMAILTLPVTQSLPSGWRGEYTFDRASKWIEERDQEGTTLLVLERSSGTPVGLMILFESDDVHSGRGVRVGYVLAEAVWGRGFATELLEGFVDWCRTVEIASIIGGVEPENVASKRVMEKSGFALLPSAVGQQELLYELKL